MATATAESRNPLRSANPALDADTFRDIAAAGSDRMTLQGTVAKAALLLALVVGAAAITWARFFAAAAAAGAGAAVRPDILMWVGVWGGLVVAILTVFKKTWSPVTAPAYAMLEGLALGGISAMFELRFPGIVIQAVALTFGTLGALLAAYRSGLIKPEENFKLGLAAATGAIALIYVVSIGLGMFGRSIPLIHESGWVGIGFSLFVVVIAALNLVLDFDFIENGSRSGAPKYMEWYAAFGLMVTLVWLYLEILRLLAKLMSRKR